MSISGVIYWSKSPWHQWVKPPLWRTIVPLQKVVSAIDAIDDWPELIHNRKLAGMHISKVYIESAIAWLRRSCRPITDRLT